MIDRISGHSCIAGVFLSNVFIVCLGIYRELQNRNYSQPNCLFSTMNNIFSHLDKKKADAQNQQI